jgi:hypothetical protein
MEPNVPPSPGPSILCQTGHATDGGVEERTNRSVLMIMTGAGAYQARWEAGVPLRDRTTLDVRPACPQDGPPPPPSLPMGARRR